MKKNPLLGKHSHNNRESKEGQILRFIREFKKLSLKDVALLLNRKSLDIDHLENGRKFYEPSDIDLFLNCYQLTKEDFNTLMELKILNKHIVNHYLQSLDKS